MKGWDLHIKQFKGCAMSFAYVSVVTSETKKMSNLFNIGWGFQFHESLQFCL